jgi:hypothetical protein
MKKKEGQNEKEEKSYRMYSSMQRTMALTVIELNKLHGK